MNNQQKYKRSKVLNGILGGVLALVIAGGVAAVGVLSNGFKDWDHIKPPAQEETEMPEDNTLNGGISIAEGESAGIKLMSAKIPVEEYATYGVSVQAESAYTVTATITPADAANKLVTWSVEWKNASSTWASGKTVTDYVTVSTATDGALTATVTNKAAFGEQIILKCVSRDNASAYATANVEYLQKVTQYNIEIPDNRIYRYNVTTGTGAFDLIEDEDGYYEPGIFLDFDSVYDFGYFDFSVTKSSVYTRAISEETELYITMKPTDELKTTIENAGLDSTKLSEYSVLVSQRSTSVDSYMDKNWGEALYGSDVAKKNKLIDTLVAFDGDAYECVVYTKQGGTKMFSFRASFDCSGIAEEKGVESIIIDQSELVFG